MGFFVWLSMTVGLWKDSGGKNSSEDFDVRCLQLDCCDFLGGWWWKYSIKWKRSHFKGGWHYQVYFQQTVFIV